MNKKLKHHSLIQDQNLSIKCPGLGTQEYELEVYRWYRADWSPEDNFLPNVLEPRPKRKIVSEIEKCAFCAMSLFDDFDFAVKKFKGYSLNARRGLGHTHVFKGLLELTDGIGSPISGNHLNFFDYEGVELHKKFTELCNFESI